MKKNNWCKVFYNPIYIGAFIALILLALILNPIISYDEALWGYIGNIWSNYGLPPYIASVENKTPGNFILYAISEYFTHGNFIIARIFGALAVLISAFYIYKITKLLHSNSAAILAMYIFGLSSCWYLVDAYVLAQTETFMVLFSILSFYFLIQAKTKLQKRNYFILAGMFLGFAISFKQIAITTYAAFFIYYWFNSKKAINKQLIINWLLFTFGVFIGLFIIYFVLYLNGVSVLNYIDGAWSILLKPGSSAPDFATRISKFSQMFFQSRFLVFYPILILCFIKSNMLKKQYVIGVFIWLAIDFIGVNASGYYYGHQLKQLLAPIAICCGIGLSSFQENKENKPCFSSRLFSILILILFLFFPYKQVTQSIRLIRAQTSEPAKELGEWLQNNAKATDYIFVLGADEFLVKSLYYANRVSSSKYFHSIFVTNKTDTKIIYNDLLDKPAKFILIEAGDLQKVDTYGEEIINYVRENYSVYKTHLNFNILRHNKID